MDLTTMQTQLDLKTGIGLSVEAQRSYLNEAVQFISAEADWPWLDATDATVLTVNAQARYTLPTDWERTRTVNVGGMDARFMNIADIDRFQYFDDVRTLWSFGVDGGSLVIAPTPTSALALIHRYVKQEPVLVNPSDTPLIPTRFHAAIVTYAAKLAMEQRGKTGRVDTFDKSWKDWKRAMVDEQRRTRGPLRIRVRNGYPI